MTQFVDNEFSENLRGINGAVLFFERTPYFEIRANVFTRNMNIKVATQLTSLSDFVSKATGLRGVTSLGNYEQLESA